MIYCAWAAKKKNLTVFVLIELSSTWAGGGRTQGGPTRVVVGGMS